MRLFLFTEGPFFCTPIPLLSRTPASSLSREPRKAVVPHHSPHTPLPGSKNFQALGTPRGKGQGLFAKSPRDSGPRIPKLCDKQSCRVFVISNVVGPGWGRDPGLVVSDPRGQGQATAALCESPAGQVGTTLLQKDSSARPAAISLSLWGLGG